MNISGLNELGLSDGQIAVYSALLDLGISSLNSIHEKTGIERRNIYDILNKLIEKGLVSYTIESKVRKYQCTHPSKIREEIDTKVKELTLLRSEIPNIIDAFNKSKPLIRAEVYRGNEAIKALLNEMLEYKFSYWIGGNAGVEKTSLNIWFSHWMKRRAESKHMMYDLVDHGMHLKGLPSNNTSKHKKLYYQYWQLPKDLSSPMVIAIFGNKVAQILWSDQPFAFVLESEEIKISFEKYFHHFWKK